MAASDRKFSINVYPVSPEKTAGNNEFRHEALLSSEATNYIDILLDEGQLTITLYRDPETDEFCIGVAIAKNDKDSGEVMERRVYRGNLFAEPFERPETDAERQALEDERMAMNRPRLMPRPILPPPADRVRPLVVDETPPTFDTGGDVEEEGADIL